MYEYHGWITIRESFSNDDEWDSQFDEILDQIKSELKKSDLGNGLTDIRSVNGSEFFVVGGFHNHSNGTTDGLLRFFKFVSEKAKGSYGVLYIHDDEDLNGEDNEFQVYVLAKGKLEKKKDILLSPYVPVVEE